MPRPFRSLSLIVTAALAFGACASDPPAWSFAPAPAQPAAAAGASHAPASAPPAASAAAPGPTAVAAAGVLGTLEFVSVDLGFEPTELHVDEPGQYEIRLVNRGAILHDITFADGTTIVANAGETASGTVDVPQGGLSFICSIPGHADAGMKGSITVGSTGGTDTGGDHAGPAPATDVQPDPNAPAYELRDPSAPAVLQGTTHDIDLVIEEKPMTVAKGFVQAVWTFNGTVPGPVIRVKVGDTIRIHLKNPATSRLPHSIDFLASQVAWNDEMTSINPGEEKLYEWTADYAGVWMYHCGTAPRAAPHRQRHLRHGHRGAARGTAAR